MKKENSEYRQGSIKNIIPVKFGGLDVRPLTRDSGLNGVSVAHITLPPGYLHELLCHPKTHEWVLVLEGSTKVVIGGKTRELRPGSFAYIPPGLPHRMGSGRTRVKVLALFSPGFDLRRPDIKILKQDKTTLRRAKTVK